MDPPIKSESCLLVDIQARQNLQLKKNYWIGLQSTEAQHAKPSSSQNTFFHQDWLAQEV
jgi:hypothetical protein